MIREEETPCKLYNGEGIIQNGLAYTSVTYCDVDFKIDLLFRVELLAR